MEVAPATDGSLWVTSTSTYVDEAILEFINDDIEHVRAASLDDAMVTMRSLPELALALNEAQKYGLGRHPRPFSCSQRLTITSRIAA